MKRETKALGYAVTELKGENLDKNLVNPVSALQGKVAGVDISGSDGGLFGSAKILIRGASTLSLSMLLTVLSLTTALRMVMQTGARTILTGVMN